MAKLTTEQAREMGRAGGKKSGETRAAKAKLRADLRARQLFVDAAEDVAQELLDAALGRGKWGRDAGPLLDPRERAAILKTCLEYGVGRPRPQDPMSTESDDDDDTPQEGFRFGVAEEGPNEGHPAEPGSPDGVRTQPAQG